MQRQLDSLLSQDVALVKHACQTIGLDQPMDRLCALGVERDGALVGVDYLGERAIKTLLQARCIEQANKKFFSPTAESDALQISIQGTLRLVAVAPTLREIEGVSRTLEGIEVVAL